MKVFLLIGLLSSSALVAMQGEDERKFQECEKALRDFRYTQSRLDTEKQAKSKNMNEPLEVHVYQTKHATYTVTGPEMSPVEIQHYGILRKRLPEIMPAAIAKMKWLQTKKHKTPNNPQEEQE